MTANLVETRPSTTPLRGSAQDGGVRPICFTPKEKDQALVQPAQLPNGRNILLLKTLLSSACERDCFYCPFCAGRELLGKSSKCGPRTEDGKQAWDTFMTLAATTTLAPRCGCSAGEKLKISFYEYVRDRVLKKNAIPPLAELIH